MSEHCWCGDVIEHAYQSWTCARCRRACCPSCAEREDGHATCVRCHETDAAVSA